MFMSLLSVILFVLAVAIFKHAVEGRDVKFELAVDLVLIVIYFIFYQIVFNWEFNIKSFKDSLLRNVKVLSKYPPN